MDKVTLRQYRSLVKEQRMLELKIQRYKDRINNLPDVYDKVEASSAEFPYVSIHIPVQAKDPQQSAQLNRLIALNEKRKQDVIKALTQIEEYIKGIPDSEDRLIFEMVYIQGKTYRDTGDALHMDYSTIAKRIANQLSTNSTKFLNNIFYKKFYRKY